MSRDPSEYIKRVMSTDDAREMYSDADYKKDRQKTTEKDKDKRKVLKIYDKSFEYRQKGKAVDDNILRLETVYRRQNRIFSMRLIFPALQTSSSGIGIMYHSRKRSSVRVAPKAAR